MTETIITYFREVFNNDILTVILISILPIIELRGAIPAAFSMGMSWYSAYAFSWLGSSLVVPFLLLLLKPLLNVMKKFRPFRALADAVESVFTDKADKVAAKAVGMEDKRAFRRKLLGVFLFVAVPLPLTGVWTGSAVAVFLGIPFGYALGAVLAGNLCAGAIMTVLSVFFRNHVHLILDIFLIIVVVIVLLYIVLLIVKMRKRKKLAADKANKEDKGEELVNSVTDIEFAAREEKRADNAEAEDSEEYDCGNSAERDGS